MKEILHNYDLLELSEINNVVNRAKALIINSSDEILLAYSDKNYQLPGGHVEDGESLKETLVREVKEETGIVISSEDSRPFIKITYMNRDYPSVGLNSTHIATYYCVKTDVKPDLTKVHLTDNEKEGNFELKYFHKDIVLQELENSLVESTRKGVVLDTMEVIKTYLEHIYNYNK